MLPDKNKVLVLDVETAPMLAYVWERRDVNVSLNQLKSDTYILAWAAKWLGDPPSKIIYADQRNAVNIEDDSKILLRLWDLLDEADILVTQNGINFDAKVLNARFMIHGLNPPSPYKHLDTYQIAKRAAKFTSHSLEYLTAKLCTKYKKLSHSKFPGMELWKQCLAGNKKAWDEMRKYNIHDVLSTEELYTKIRAWAPTNAPAVYNSLAACPACGSDASQRRGYTFTRASMTHRIRCLDCGKWRLGERIKREGVR